MKNRFADLAVAAVVLGTLQALVETFALAWLHRDLLLAPYRFFPTHAYDAFTKLWFLASDALPLPSLLTEFVAQGFAAKLALAPELVAINLAVAIAAALVLAPVAGVLGVGRGASVGRAVVVMAAFALVVHLALWAAAFQAPETITMKKLARQVARDLAQGGAGLALVVLAVSALAARIVVLRRPSTLTAALVGVAFAAAAAIGGAGDATARAPIGDDAVQAAGPAEGYNVVLISIDSLRADHLGAYGYGRATSPAIDDLAAGGVLFRNSISTSSWTLPSHMSLLTGRSLLGHGVVSDDRSLPKSVGTIAEAFQAGGYRTHAIVSAPYVHSRYGFAKGFDEYDDRTIYFETNEDSYRSVTGPRLVDAAHEFLAGAGDRPFFLFLHFWDVHYDYAPGPPYDTMFDPDYEGTVDGNNFYFDPKIHAGMDRRDLEHLVALYDGEIRLVDDQIARLRAELERLGLAGRTIFAVVADHGDEFFEHGNKGHHRTLYEEVLHTPFVLNVPGRRPSRGELDDEVSLLDVGPTLLGLAGLDAPEAVEGRDYSGLYGGAPLPAPGAVRAELYRTGTRNVQVASIEARRKVIHHFQRRWLETYDLAADPGEQRVLGPRGPEAAPLVSGLKEWLDTRWHRFDKRVRTEGIEPVILDEKALEQLRSLGYLN